MAKHAQMNNIVNMILLAIAAILLFTVGTIIYKTYTAKGVEEVCRMSVISQQNTEILGTSVLKLDCKRRYVQIFPDHAELGYEPDSTDKYAVMVDGEKKNKYRNVTNEIVNYIVAEEMKTCWYEFGEAQTEVFPNDETAGTGKDDICFTCSQITFSDIPAQAEYSGLVDYLKTHYPKDAKYTYWEYFNRPSLSKNSLESYMTDIGKSDFEDAWNDRPLSFNPTALYSVVFYKDYDNLGKNGYHVLVIPSENTDDICEVPAS